MKEIIVLPLGLLFIFGLILITGLSVESCEKTDMAKAGLQQCLVENRVIWQKECK